MQNTNLFLLFVSISGLFLSSCGTLNCIPLNDLSLLTPGQTYLVDTNIDLKGKTIHLPPEVTLVCGRGIIKNGVIMGDSTRIRGSRPLFERVTIKGSWLVPDISTRLFVDLAYDNSLRDVFALSSNTLTNSIHIERGRYYVTASSGGGALSMTSNTSLQIDGEIILRPNEFSQCYVLLVRDVQNIRITGNGIIMGDKDSHLGTSGEWGMGIHVVGSKNVMISKVTIRNCWGDCIYVGKESEDIQIMGCLLDNGRRQGISITSAKNVLISDCKIMNVSGTLPGYAIDIEPNKSQQIENVTVMRVKIDSCSGGLLVYGNASGASVRDITFSGCFISGILTRCPISVSTADHVSIIGCTAEFDLPHAVRVSKVMNLKIQNNFLSSSSEAIVLDHCSNSAVTGNHIKNEGQ